MVVLGVGSAVGLASEFFLEGVDEHFLVECSFSVLGEFSGQGEIFVDESLFVGFEVVVEVPEVALLLDF